MQKENAAPKNKGKIPKKKPHSFTSKCDLIICCDFCLSPIKKRIIECNQCQKKYHLNCIPTAHRVHVPEEDDDSFLCHMCYRESNSDSSDGEVGYLFSTICEEAKKQGFD